MNPVPDYVKTCHRCGKPTRLTPEQFALERDQVETTCAPCRAVLKVEAEHVLKSAEPCPAPIREFQKAVEAACAPCPSGPPYVTKSPFSKETITSPATPAYDI